MFILFFTKIYIITQVFLKSLNSRENPLIYLKFIGILSILAEINGPVMKI